MKIISVVGARPNFMKIAPLAREFAKSKKIEHQIVHTGQHYDRKMSKLFFEDLKIPKPDVHMGVGSGTHTVQTAKIMIGFEQVLLESKPDLVIVVGDVNSTVACALTATKMQIPVAHIEAGLRSNDRGMPEELNRLVTDTLSDLFFTTCKEADTNLIGSGAMKEQIFFVGNLMIDTLLFNIKRAKSSDVLKKLDLKKGKFALLTMHRPSNVDDEDGLETLYQIVKNTEQHIDVVFPIHPRTKSQLQSYGLLKKFKALKGLTMIPPQGYLDFLKLMSNSKLILTDSGGIQEESSALGIPCLTLRDSTERPITVSHGTNYLVGNDIDNVHRHLLKILSGRNKKGGTIAKWDGKTSARIRKILESEQAKALLASAFTIRT